ncbi:AGAP010713-PA-like protein [Anopheles sinensis]|uniref:E3 ubiquitin-protein ligase E3D n=1 Tax=Anopheles sinensis TaxID=74873 RepID=A0A084WNK0_ANOSI|nr:AGAP010713-PA-like protein [Anopheles sinensis]
MVPSSTGNIERVLIELRPRLQSANFFIAFRRNFADIESTTIDLANDRLTIAIGKGAAARERYEIRVGDFFQLHTQTLSSLVIKNRYLCFRVNTNESSFGTELLNMQQEGGGGSALEEYEQLKLAVNVEPDVRYVLLCSNCGGSLNAQPDTEIEGVAFRRVLELPSEQMDANEWFCHGHDHSTGEATGGTSHQGEKHEKLTINKLEPQPCDLLYGPFYALLHRTALQRVHIRNDRFVHCRRCLQFLGTCQKSRPCVKLWHEGVRFQPIAGSRVPMSLFRVDDPLDLFRLLVRKTVRECNFVTHLGLPPMFKLMFELHRPGLEGDVFYLLLQIMDSGLSVFRIDPKRTEPESSGSCSEDIDDVGMACPQLNTEDGQNRKEAEDDDDDDDDVFIESSCRKHNIALQRHRAMKLMYWYEKYEQQPLFTFWREDSNVVNLELSEPMFTAAIRYLDKNSSYVPECYRVNQGFSMSYLDIT